MKAFLFATLLAASGAAPVYTPSMAETSEDTLDASSADLTAHADAGREPEARAGWKDYMDQGLSTAHDFTAQGVAGEESFGPLANATEAAFDALNAEGRASQGLARDNTEAAFDTPRGYILPPLPPTPRRGVNAATTSILDTMSSSFDDVYQSNLNYAVETLEDKITTTAEQAKPKADGNSIESSAEEADSSLAPDDAAPPAAAENSVASLSDAITTAIEDALVQSLQSFGAIDSAVGGSEMDSEFDSSETDSENDGSEMATELDSFETGSAIDSGMVSEMDSEVGSEDATQWSPADPADVVEEEEAVEEDNDEGEVTEAAEYPPLTGLVG